jgi:hypothetical protein
MRLVRSPCCVFPLLLIGGLQDRLAASVCVSVFVYPLFCFLCGPYSIKGKQAISSSQKFFFHYIFIYFMYG